MADELSLFDFIDDDVCSDTTIANVDDDIAIDALANPYDKSLVEVRRSKRRKKSSEAYRSGGKVVVVVPWRLSQREIELTVDELLKKLQQIEIRHANPSQLMSRAQFLVDTYLDHDVIGQHHVPVTIKWVTNQNTRWGSCTPATGTIRLSHRVQTMPEYVQDAVLLHELIHLIVLAHNEEFHNFMNRYPELARATAFLAGYALARHEQN